MIDSSRVAVLTLALSAALAFSAQSASATTITFEADPEGVKPNGFVSEDSRLVSFSDTEGADLAVFNFPFPIPNRVLGVFPTPPLTTPPTTDFSYLLMNFAQNVNSLSLLFGNDAQDTFAWLLTPVGSARVEVNGDGLVNQMISFSGAEFNVAGFYFGDENGVVLNQRIEVVDNITFNVVPEPATMLLLGAGLSGLVARRRRAQR